MKTHLLTVIFLSFATGPLLAASAGSVFPNESLDYSINWPSGLSLGEAHWHAQNTGSAETPEWHFGLDLDARIPGFALIDSFNSTSTSGYCTQTFTKTQQHGDRKSGEKIEVDQSAHTAKRMPVKGGGESQIYVPDCVHDPLALLFLARHELISGRIPSAQKVLFGSLYDVTLTFQNEVTIKGPGGAPQKADAVNCHIKGPASDFNAQIVFARDAVRTPVSISVPLAIGTFSLELNR